MDKFLEVRMSFLKNGSFAYESYRERFIDNICAACSALIKYGQKKVIPEFIPNDIELDKYAVMLKITAIGKDDNLAVYITYEQNPETIFHIVREVIWKLCQKDKYSEILNLDYKLTEENITHELLHNEDGWQILLFDNLTNKQYSILENHYSKEHELNLLEVMDYDTFEVRICTAEQIMKFF